MKHLYLFVSLALLAIMPGISRSQNGPQQNAALLNQLKQQKVAELLNQRQGGNDLQTLSAPEQDCINAIPITYGTYYQPNSYSGEGAVLYEISNSCLAAGERNDVWYTFSPVGTGQLGFSIIPNDTTNDYDWAVYDITGYTCADISTTAGLEISCNFSAMWGITGPNGMSSAACNPLMNVQAGRTYVLNVSNFSGSQSGYTLSFINWQTLFVPVKIAGHVFTDNDSNCVQGAGEAALKNRLIEITPGPAYITTDSTGYYEVFADTGVYNVHLVPKNYHYQSCPLAPVDYTVSLLNVGDSSLNNFGDQAIPNVQDLQVIITTGFFRPGFYSPVNITYRNTGTTVMNGNVNLQYDPMLTLVSASTSYSSSTNNTLQWSYSNLQPDEERYINLVMHTDSTIALGSQLAFYGQVTPEGQDTTPGDNRDTVIVIVIGSYDPNCKLVEPAGAEAAGYIAPGQELTYTIHFQNTGSDTAFTVVVRDPLDSDLDITSFKMLAASHPYTYTITGSGYLTCRFDNIMLPDANTNEPASHGFFKFSIKPKANLPNYTQLTNTGYIYFDYNAPIITDTTLNTVLSTVGIAETAGSAGYEQVLVYPNPASSSVSFIFDKQSDAQELVLYNIAGKEVKRAKAEVPATSITVSDLPQGLYLYKVRKSNGEVLTGKLVIMRTE